MKPSGFARPSSALSVLFEHHDIVLFDEPIEIRWEGERDLILGFAVTFLPEVAWGGLLASQASPRARIEEGGDVRYVGKPSRLVDYNESGVIFTSTSIACVLTEPEPVVMVGRRGEGRVDGDVPVFKLVIRPQKFRIKEGVRILAEVPRREGIEGLQRAVERIL